MSRDFPKISRDQVSLIFALARRAILMVLEDVANIRTSYNTDTCTENMYEWALYT